MSIKKLSGLISDMEATISGLKREKQAERIDRKISRLVKAMETGKVENPARVEKKLSTVKRQYETSELSLQEVEEKIDEIYGDQSDNSTYYFSRQAAEEESMKDERAWMEFQNDLDMTLEETEKVVDQFYGNQSDNETYYDDRESSSEGNWYDSKKK